MKWFVFTQWEIAPDEAGQTFEQKFTLASEDGATTVLQSRTDFVAEEGKQLHRIIGSFNFFPLLAAGHYRLKLYLRSRGQEQWGNEVASYPVEIILQKPALAAHEIQA
jgi:hypothetical protein